MIMANKPTMAGMGAGQEGMPAMPSMKPMLITLMIMMVIMFFNEQIGKALNYVFEPIIGFDGKYVVLTLVLAGIIMTGISTIIRGLMSDMVSQTKSQREMKAFQAELRQARLENNLYKIKKLTAQQQTMMSKQMEGTSGMMKTMPITMLIVIPIYAWVRYFVNNVAADIGTAVINVPWGSMDLSASLWYIVIIYTLISIPFGQLVGRLMRAYEFRKRLKELDAGDIEVV